MATTRILAARQLRHFGALARTVRHERPALAVARGWAPARTLAIKTDPASVLPEVKGAEPGEMADIMDQATGLERGEIENPDLFKHNEVLQTHFGTRDNPVKIQSVYDSRVVGCTGQAAPDDHDIVWFTLKKGKPFECPECFQVFVLDPL